jgi:hypothetical protein
VSTDKIFGYPTGLGALLVRSDAVDILRKVFWGGGTVSLATSADDFHVLKCRCELLSVLLGGLLSRNCDLCLKCLFNWVHESVN